MRDNLLNQDFLLYRVRFIERQSGILLQNKQITLHCGLERDLPVIAADQLRLFIIQQLFKMIEADTQLIAGFGLTHILPQVLAQLVSCS
ncbi:hypothetical protein D3C80_1914560 [compost metagenome]